jgi:HEPN domain-containing protein
MLVVAVFDAVLTVVVMDYPPNPCLVPFCQQRMVVCRFSCHSSSSGRLRQGHHSSWFFVHVLVRAGAADAIGGAADRGGGMNRGQAPWQGDGDHNDSGLFPLSFPLADRSQDWFDQALRDLDQARQSADSARHEWACFAAHQAAEKALKALHLAVGQQGWGHTLTRLWDAIPEPEGFHPPPPSEIKDRLRLLDGFYTLPVTPTATRKARRANTLDNFRANKPSTTPQHGMDRCCDGMNESVLEHCAGSGCSAGIRAACS